MISEGDKCPQCKSGTMVERNGRYGKFLGCSRYRFGCKNTAKIAKEETSAETRANALRYNDGNSAPAEYKRIDLSSLALSDYQIAILSAVKSSDDNLIIRAAAGSGKSFTLRLIAQEVDPSLSVMYATFDKRSTEDIKDKLPPHVNISTWHSYGFRAIRSAFRGVRLNEHKTLGILDRIEERTYISAYREAIHEARFDLARLISRAKNELHLVSDPHIPWEDIADRIGINLNGDAEFLYTVLDNAYHESAAMRREVDFDDMIYFPAAGIVRAGERYDLALLDESQDLNKPQLVLAMSAANRVIIVGDEHQAIYLFRGADSESMNRLQDHFRASPLPLSICYRCGTRIIEHVNKTYPDIPILPYANNPAGTVNLSIDYTDVIKSILPGDNILCRTNAPLVKPCFELIRAGKKAVILGRDIGKSLVDLAKKMSKRVNSQDMSDILFALDAWTYEQIERLTARKKEHEIEKFQDQRDTIHELAKEVDTLQEFSRIIEDLFSDNREGVILSTVHKSKGSECDNVYILRPDLIPLKTGDPQEEENIGYVAMTRGKISLSFINPDSHK